MSTGNSADATAGAPPAIDDFHDDIAEALAGPGFWVGEHAFDEAEVQRLRAELDRLVEADALRRAGIGRERDFQLDRSIRADRIHWLGAGHPEHLRFLAFAERLRLALNRRLFLGLFEFEAHFALYPPGGYYRQHTDAFRGQANRLVSLVAFLNPDWHEGDGGELVLYEADGEQALRRVPPRGGTLAVFLSEEVPHEVLPTRRDRASIAGWFRCNTSTMDQVDPPR
ncbi:MAG: 2OG-Fe(II) oxygenase [Wenzhouxiangellaceae bacterium]|nr:2OG-Fe(II) oxygenase [Wenzhouxiangellaceae bacterium]